MNQSSATVNRKHTPGRNFFFQRDSMFSRLQGYKEFTALIYFLKEELFENDSIKNVCILAISIKVVACYLRTGSFEMKL